MCLLYKRYFDGQHHNLTSSFREERLLLYQHLKSFESHPVTGDVNIVTSTERNRRELLFVAGFLTGIFNL